MIKLETWLIVGSTGAVGSQIIHHLHRVYCSKNFDSCDPPSDVTLHPIDKRLADSLPNQLHLILPIRTPSSWLSDMSVFWQRQASSTGLNITLTTYDQLDGVVSTTEIHRYLCCLGTTRRQAGKSGLWAVDHDLVVETAAKAFNSGARSSYVISALGARSKSLFFYNRVKGRMEKQLQDIGFDECHILQPSLITAERNPPRLLEHWTSEILRWLPISAIQPLSSRLIALSLLLMTVTPKSSNKLSKAVFRYQVKEILATLNAINITSKNL